MTRNLLLIAIFLILSAGFWLLPDTKEIAAGVTIFLLGMLWLQDGFKAFTGGVLEQFLARATRTVPRSLLFGAGITTLMQSSSLVSLIAISFISAGLITLVQGIGIIFGANLGTTTGAWLVAGFGLKVDIAAYAMPLLVFGVILQFQKSRKSLKGLGAILGGVGFLFLGIAFMKSGFEGFGNQTDLSQFALPGRKGLLLYTGVGVLATVVMQSSHATLLLTITALASHQVSYENALALAIGSNVGTTITALLGALGAKAAGRQLAAAHLLFNLATGAVALLGIQHFVQAVNWFSDALGIGSANYTLKLALFHSLFNLIGVLLMLPVIQPLAHWLQRHITESPPEQKTLQPRYLNNSALTLPDTALSVLRQEVGYLAKRTFKILAHGLNLHRKDILSKAAMREVVARSNVDLSMHIRNSYRHKIKPIYSAILIFCTRASATMSPQQILELEQLRFAARRLVHSIKIMDELQRNMSRYARSENPAIQQEYNRMRRLLGKMLRAMFGLGNIKGFGALQTRLQELQRRVERNDAAANGTLDRLIREQLIAPEMATSLMNDCDFVNGLTRALVDASYALYGDIESLREQASFVDPRLDAVS